MGRELINKNSITVLGRRFSAKIKCFPFLLDFSYSIFFSDDIWYTRELERSPTGYVLKMASTQLGQLPV